MEKIKNRVLKLKEYLKLTFDGRTSILGMLVEGINEIFEGFVDLDEIQEKQFVWAKNNFGIQNPNDMIFGMMEELGELSHATLKNKQKIRGYENEKKYIEERDDAIGDLVIYLMNYCSLNQIDLSKVIAKTWEQVEIRSWKNFPDNADVIAPIAAEKIGEHTDQEMMKDQPGKFESMEEYYKRLLQEKYKYIDELKFDIRNLKIEVQKLRNTINGIIAGSDFK